MSQPVEGPVRFFFDFISPYAYLAWTQIHRVAEGAGRRVEPTAVLFAALLNAHGQKGPAEIPAKRAYLFKNVVRLAHDFGVPLAPPPAHPFNPLLALRAASIPMNQSARRALIDALFRRVWGGGAGVTDPKEVESAAREAGLDGAAIVEEAMSQEAKDRLTRQTKEALERGSFGVPSMAVGEELFWGVDSLAHLAAHLAGRDPVDPAAVARWEQLPASANRVKRQSDGNV